MLLIVVLVVEYRIAPITTDTYGDIEILGEGQAEATFTYLSLNRKERLSNILPNVFHFFGV